MTSAPMRIPVRPLLDPERTIDLHDTLVRAIEQEISQRYKGNSVLNRLEAEAQLAALLHVGTDSDLSDSTRKACHE